MKIQIVEDDRALSDGIVLAVTEDGIEFIQSMNLSSAVPAYEAGQPDMVILDINLPDGSGYDYLKWLRERSEIPVLMLTANDMEMDEVMGLSLGADDYMTKPFSLAVLRARIKVLQKRICTRERMVYREDEYSFDFDRMEFTKDGKELLFSKNEQRLLRLFLENRGRLLTRDLLIDRIWPDGGQYVDENALSVTVNRLRAKLEDKKKKVTYIQTVYGQGYLWRREGVFKERPTIKSQ